MLQLTVYSLPGPCIFISRFPSKIRNFGFGFDLFNISSTASTMRKMCFFVPIKKGGNPLPRVPANLQPFFEPALDPPPLIKFLSNLFIIDLFNFIFVLPLLHLLFYFSFYSVYFCPDVSGKLDGNGFLGFSWCKWAGIQKSRLGPILGQISNIFWIFFPSCLQISAYTNLQVQLGGWKKFRRTGKGWLLIKIPQLDLAPTRSKKVQKTGKWVLHSLTCLLI